MFFGEHDSHVVGNRISIPIRLRKGMGDSVFLAPDKRSGCVSLIPCESDHLISRDALRAEIDLYNRIQIPNSLSKFFPNRDIVFLGVGNSIEVWDREKWKDYKAKPSFRELLASKI
ncbi:MAG: division/cell wall cluster transcriptional repressor MraZ [Candidatus Pacebacteria bacterium]|nr:division/cell wall cluster transcriptional repressor MraZ [Candidatus Paceibacterota bacterium]